MHLFTPDDVAQHTSALAPGHLLSRLLFQQCQY